MRNILVILCCIVAVSNAFPSTDFNNKEVNKSKFESNGPQPVDEVIAITDDGTETPSKRVARHYGFGGVSVGIGVPYIVPSYGYGYPVYGGYGYGGYGGYGYRGGYGGYRRYGGYRGYGHHHHHW